MLMVGFLPGIKVKTIPLFKQAETPQGVMIDKFITDIREFSTSISGCESPAAIIMFNDFQADIRTVMGKLDHALSLDTVIVGDCGIFLQHANGSSRNRTATIEHAFVVALVFVADRKRPPGIGQTQFHAIISSGLLSICPAYEVTSVKEAHQSLLTARREGSHENLDGETILNQAFEELGDRTDVSHFYIGLTKKRKCFIELEKVGWMTSFSLHKVAGLHEEDLIVDVIGIQTGDTFRIYHPDSTTALLSVAGVSNHLRSFKQAGTTGGDKREVFGGLIFNSSGRGESFFGQPNVDSSPFLDNFPGVTLGGTFCHQGIGRGDLTPYVKESQEQKPGRCCLHEYGSIYLIMSYTP